MISSVQKVAFLGEAIMYSYHRSVGFSDISLTIVNNGKAPSAIQIILVRIYSDVSNAPAAGFSLQFDQCQMSHFFACPLHLDQRRPVEKAGKRNCVGFVPAIPARAQNRVHPASQLGPSGRAAEWQPNRDDCSTHI